MTPPPPPPQSVQLISDCFIKPSQLPDGSNRPLHLPPWDLAMLSVHYIQKGLLFPLPPRCLKAGFDRPAFIHSFLEKLKRSLSSALFHFYPLAGRFATLKQTDPPFYTVFVDCANSPGARFIHATLDMTVADILSPTYVPDVVQSFFDHDRAIDHDGHTLSLLSVQVTELADGVFIGLSMNHAIADGTSFWLFFNSWSEIFQAQEKGAVDVVQLSRPPVLTRWFPENHPGPLSLPYTDDPSSFLARFESPELRERVFHFSADAIAELKAEANRQCGTTNISSFQSLTALIWRCITRARHFPPNQVTGCRMAANNRARLDPQLSPEYFGNSINFLRTAATVGELLGSGLGWAAQLLHAAVAGHSNAKLREWNEDWIKRPQVYNPDKTFDRYSVMMGSSPRFDKYGSEFGLGKAVALRSGYANKWDGKASGYPGREGGGSVDLEICLPPVTMALLEADPEFMAAVTVS
ncbi:uncharacterized acetyltransferase At3g50280 [Eucalyptus grandis]|uniref:uncharacterized acetyltransferase At3g50280 n=1 Tax=Eucalyptus grandis TaxID=71139 RepID=UPI00192EFDA1|nr:uncharacterized acetyltransferase At3g50280 [Eucalyptus grandis]